MGIFSRNFRRDPDDLENMYLCRETPYECLKSMTNLFPGAGSSDLVPAVRIKPYYKFKVFFFVAWIVLSLLGFIAFGDNVSHNSWNLYLLRNFLVFFILFIAVVFLCIWQVRDAHHIKFYPKGIVAYSGASPLKGHWQSFLCGVKHDIVKKHCGDEIKEVSVQGEFVDISHTYRKALYDVCIDGCSIASQLYQKDADMLVKYLKFYLDGNSEPIRKSHQISYNENSEPIHKSHQISYQTLDKDKADPAVEKFNPSDHL